ncbi:hypothetical protein ACWC2M_02975, partial [Streptomyces sp. NPDC001761]
FTVRAPYGLQALAEADTIILPGVARPPAGVTGAGHRLPQDGRHVVSRSAVIRHLPTAPTCRRPPP